MWPPRAQTFLNYLIFFLNFKSRNDLSRKPSKREKMWERGSKRTRTAQTPTNIHSKAESYQFLHQSTDTKLNGHASLSMSIVCALINLKK